MEPATILIIKQIILVTVITMTIAVAYALLLTAGYSFIYGRNRDTSREASDPDNDTSTV